MLQIELEVIDKLMHMAENPLSDDVLGDVAEEALDRIYPRNRGQREVLHDPSRPEPCIPFRHHGLTHADFLSHFDLTHPVSPAENNAGPVDHPMMGGRVFDNLQKSMPLSFTKLNGSNRSGYDRLPYDPLGLIQTMNDHPTRLDGQAHLPLALSATAESDRCRRI